MRKPRALAPHLATALDYVTIGHAAEICHTPWTMRDPEIDEARRREAIEDSRREADDYTTDNAQDWER